MKISVKIFRVSLSAEFASLLTKKHEPYKMEEGDIIDICSRLDKTNFDTYNDKEYFLSMLCLSLSKHLKINANSYIKIWNTIEKLSQEHFLYETFLVAIYLLNELMNSTSLSKKAETDIKTTLHGIFSCLYAEQLTNSLAIKGSSIFSQLGANKKILQSKEGRKMRIINLRLQKRSFQHLIGKELNNKIIELDFIYCKEKKLNAYKNYNNWNYFKLGLKAGTVETSELSHIHSVIMLYRF